jgi:uncharacterized membrane protein (DUF485 family)
MTGYLAFLVAHVALVALTGFARNMNHIVLGTDDQSHLGMVLGFVGMAMVITSWIAAHYISWRSPRALQHIQKALSQPLRLATLNRLAPSEQYTTGQISPYFWPNGKMPEREDWKQLGSPPPPHWGNLMFVFLTQCPGGAHSMTSLIASDGC